MTAKEAGGIEHLDCETTEERAMSGRVILELISKDVERYWKEAIGLAGVVALAMGLPAIMLKGSTLQEELVLFEVGTIVIFLPTQVAQWLVAHERLRRTMSFLKILPISPSEVVWAKVLAACLLVTASFIIFCLVPFAIGMLVANVSVWILLALLALHMISFLNCAFCVTLFLVIERPIVVAVPFAVVGLSGASAIYLFDRMGLKQAPVVETLLRSTGWQIALFAILLIIWLGSFAGLFQLAKYGYRRIQG